MYCCLVNRACHLPRRRIGINTCTTLYIDLPTTNVSSPLSYILIVFIDVINLVLDLDLDLDSHAQVCYLLQLHTRTGILCCRNLDTAALFLDYFRPFCTISFNLSQLLPQEA